MYAKKAKIYLLMYTNHEKISYPICYPFNDFKQRQMVLTCRKKMSALLRGITSKYHGNFFYLNCLYSFATENKRESHKKSMWK